MRRYKIALLGYYGFGNLGDELLLRACINILERCEIPREKIVVLSNNPDETTRNFQVNSINRWKWGEVARTLRNSDALMLGGGGIFQDATSVKSCVWYWAILRLAKFFGCKIFALGQSVGPLNSRAGKFFAGNALKSCKILHVRDENSLNAAKNLGCKKIILGCDLVMTLKSPCPPCQGGIPATGGRGGLHNTDNPATGENITLLNLRPNEKLASFIKILEKNLAGKNILGVALAPEDEEALKKFSGLQKIIRVKNFDEAQKIFCSASSCVGMRLHFGVLARIFRVPLALLPYDAKVSEFARQSGAACIDEKFCEPVMPLPVPENFSELEEICREISSL